MLINRYRAPAPIKEWKGKKPPLPMKVAYRCRVHYLDLQAYLDKVYRLRDYDILKTLGVSHGECPEFLVTGRMPPASNVEQQIENIKRGRRTRNLGLILNLLCRDGFIIAGEYIIDTTKARKPINEYTELLSKHEDPEHQECKAFRKKHRGQTFQRQADQLDRLAKEFKEERETP
jgi:hypothetical protein